MKSNQNSLNVSMNHPVDMNPSTSTSDAELKLKLKDLREENLAQNEKLKATLKDNDTLSKVAIETKVKCADLNLENDELAYKLQQKSE